MRIALVAGESSGDLLGAGLIQALGEHFPDIRCEGVAGPRMEAAGCDVLENSEILAVMGLVEPLMEIPKLLRLRRTLVERWTVDPPDVFVGIDAPDFNLGLEKLLKSRGIKTVHYVSPSVWAWRQGRVKKIARAVDNVLCLLPFEKDFYDEHGVTAEFVGHPMADETPVEPDMAAARMALAITSTEVVAVLPGSRKSEVSRLGPIFAETCALLAKTHPELSFAAPMATARIRESFADHLDAHNIRDRFVLTDGDAEKVMTAANVVLLASGTASLQAALLRKPMVAAYRFAPLTYAIVRIFNLVKVPHMTLPNLLTDKPFVPEFLQAAVKPGALATVVSELLSDHGRCRDIAEQFRSLRIDLARDANKRAAAAVAALVNEQ